MSSSAEFYFKDGSKLLARVSNVGAVPREGELISIAKKLWTVTRVTWAIDNANAPGYTPELRANINLEETNV